ESRQEIISWSAAGVKARRRSTKFGAAPAGVPDGAALLFARAPRPRRKTKSGLPVSTCPRRQPVSPCAEKKAGLDDKWGGFFRREVALDRKGAGILRQEVAL